MTINNRNQKSFIHRQTVRGDIAKDVARYTEELASSSTGHWLFFLAHLCMLAMCCSLFGVHGLVYLVVSSVFLGNTLLNLYRESKMFRWAVRGSAGAVAYLVISTFWDAPSYCLKAFWNAKV